MAKQKFYAVKNGIKTGIFNSWAECEAQVKGFKGAQFKSFESLKEAEDYLENKKEKELSFSPDTITAYVDGSFDKAHNVFGWGCVLIDHNSNIQKYCGGDNNIEYIEHRNVAGEIMGSMFAINYAIKNNFKNINIFYDYAGLKHWAIKEWKANKPLTKEYSDFCQKALKKIEISFNKVKAHTGDNFNEEADKLAKKGVSSFIEKHMNN